MWSWESDAFGISAPLQDPDGNGVPTVINLRFPGQYYDAESGLHYNGHRYYDPKMGRYISSDPVGLSGGINTYAYGESNPVNNLDLDGLRVRGTGTYRGPFSRTQPRVGDPLGIYPRLGTPYVRPTITPQIPFEQLHRAARSNVNGVNAYRPLALSLQDSLEGFARDQNANTYGDVAEFYPPSSLWQIPVMNEIYNRNVPLRVNLTGLRRPAGGGPREAALQSAQRGALLNPGFRNPYGSNYVGWTDWELTQIQRARPDGYNVLYFENGNSVPNPFEPF